MDPVLDEIDRILDAVRARPTPTPEGGEEPDPSGSPPAPVRREEPSPDSEGAPSPYLDDRLAGARDAAVVLGRRLHALEEESQDLTATVDSLQSELDHASDELAYIRSREWSGGDVAPGSGGRGRGGFQGSPPSEAGSGRGYVGSRHIAGRSGHGPTRPYHEFTATRYNRTVGSLHDRRRTLAWWTLLLAALISGALITLLALAREPVPALWLASLPGIWLIPVPFFIASFRGTHRLLRRHPLRLPGAP